MRWKTYKIFINFSFKNKSKPFFSFHCCHWKPKRNIVFAVYPFSQVIRNCSFSDNFSKYSFCITYRFLKICLATTFSFFMFKTPASSLKYFYRKLFLFVKQNFQVQRNLLVKPKNRIQFVGDLWVWRRQQTRQQEGPFVVSEINRGFKN